MDGLVNSLADQAREIRCTLDDGQGMSINEQRNVLMALEAFLAADPERPCSTHPDAPHGFDRNGSHNAGHYVCDCEGWMPPDTDAQVIENAIAEVKLVRRFHFAHNPANTGLAAGFNSILAVLNRKGTSP